MIRCLVGLGFLSVVGLAQEDARALFTAQCGVCHGDGHGTERGPNLTNNRKVRGWDNDQLRAAIRNGVPASGMPAFESLSAADLERLTVLVRSFNATAADARVAGDKVAGE